MKKYTRFEIAEFILGYSTEGQHWYSVEDIKGIIGNAKVMLEDGQNGIEATFDRRDRDRDRFPENLPIGLQSKLDKEAYRKTPEGRAHLKYKM